MRLMTVASTVASSVASVVVSRCRSPWLAADAETVAVRAGQERCRHRSVADRLVELEKELAGLRGSAGAVADAIDRGNFASGYASLETALGALGGDTGTADDRLARLAEGRERVDRALDALYAAVLRQGITAFPRAARQLAHLARIGTIVGEVFDAERRAADGRGSPASGAGRFVQGSPTHERLRACLDEIRTARHALVAGSAAADETPDPAANPARGTAA
jgi:hypothetical protein